MVSIGCTNTCGTAGCGSAQRRSAEVKASVWAVKAQRLGNGTAGDLTMRWGGWGTAAVRLRGGAGGLGGGGLCARDKWTGGSPEEVYALRAQHLRNRARQRARRHGVVVAASAERGEGGGREGAARREERSSNPPRDARRQLTPRSALGVARTRQAHRGPCQQQQRSNQQARGGWWSYLVACCVRVLLLVPSLRRVRRMQVSRLWTPFAPYLVVCGLARLAEWLQLDARCSAAGPRCCSCAWQDEQCWATSTRWTA